jgi:hypothetical protein
MKARLAPSLTLFKAVTRRSQSQCKANRRRLHRKKAVDCGPRRFRFWLINVRAWRSLYRLREPIAPWLFPTGERFVHLARARNIMTLSPCQSMRTLISTCSCLALLYNFSHFLVSSELLYFLPVPRRLQSDSSCIRTPSFRSTRSF